jgi:hypothetical protein
MRETIVVAGSLAQKPWHGGHAWVLLQYLLGFRKLGWKVVFVDQLETEMCVSADGKACPLERSVNMEYLLRVMKDFNLDGEYALLYDKGAQCLGMSRQQLLESTGRSALLLNVMGFLRDKEILDRAPKRVLLDIDPGFGQMWQDLGLHATFQGHHDYVTIGENIGEPECGIPTCGLKWITTRPPVDLDYWKPSGDCVRSGFTTIASWRGAYGPVNFQGKTYGLRVHEFRKFASLPLLTGQRFEVALDMHSADEADRVLLQKNGWLLTDPRNAASDPWRYRTYIENSSAEFMVAKNMYVATASGWISDRSICYLASGKPVLTQDTGLQGLYPIGKGLLTFSSIDEAKSGVAKIAEDYRTHAAAARSLAVEYFDSNKVLRRLLNQVCVN